MAMLKLKDLVGQPRLIHHHLVNQEQIVLLLIPPPRQEVAQPGNIRTKCFYADCVKLETIIVLYCLTI